MTVNVIPTYDNYGHEIATDISEEEINQYLKRAEKKFGDKCDRLDIYIVGDEVELRYHLVNLPFERIRRITGYLVGTMDRWNNAKKAEERDRVKHKA